MHIKCTSQFCSITKDNFVLLTWIMNSLFSHCLHVCIFSFDADLSLRFPNIPGKVYFMKGVQNILPRIVRAMCTTIWTYPCSPSQILPVYRCCMSLMSACLFPKVKGSPGKKSYPPIAHAGCTSQVRNHHRIKDGPN